MDTSTTDHLIYLFIFFIYLFFNGNLNHRSSYLFIYFYLLIFKPKLQTQIVLFDEKMLCSQAKP